MCQFLSTVGDLSAVFLVAFQALRWTGSRVCLLRNPPLTTVMAMDDESEPWRPQSLGRWRGRSVTPQTPSVTTDRPRADGSSAVSDSSWTQVPQELSSGQCEEPGPSVLEMKWRLILVRYQGLKNFKTRFHELGEVLKARKALHKRLGL